MVALSYQLSWNPTAWVGIALCVFILLVWFDKDTIYINRRRERDGD